MRREWDITQDAFDKFLTWLDPNREQAGAKHEEVRRKLMRFFACRGWQSEGEELADETINRVIIKMRDLADSYVGDCLPYFLGVARNVHHEQLEIQERWRRARALQTPTVTELSDEKERLDQCLGECMKSLTPENRELIRKYYTGDKHDKIVNRKELAEQVSIAPNALRLRAHRIRTDLRGCVENCVGKENGDETYSSNYH
jgi:DNA-directed RNA polymerase specialized sigma24 family protein